MIVKDKGGDQYRADVWDISAVLNYRPSKYHTLEAFFFTTNDYLKVKYSSNSLAQNWKTLIGKVAWKANLGDKWRLNASGYYDSAYSSQVTAEYRSDIQGNPDMTSELGVSSGLDEYSLRTKAVYHPRKDLTIDFGTSWQSQRFTPGNKKYVTQDGSEKRSPAPSGNEVSLKDDLIGLFCDVEYSPLRMLFLKLGYRHILQKSDLGTAQGYDLHALTDISLGNHLGIEMTYDRMTQSYHTMEGLPTGWSMNIMVPASLDWPAEITDQYYGGLYFRTISDAIRLNVSLGGYYRDMSNLVTYVNGINAFGLESERWEEETDIGKGRSYGAELSLRLDSEKSHTTIAYTHSKTDRRFPKLNSGESFPFKFDRRHILNLQSQYTFSKKSTKGGSLLHHSLNVVLAYSSGNRATIPVGYYKGMMPPYWSQMESGIIFGDQFYNQIYDRQLMSARNGYLLKDYFRVDLGYILKFEGRKVTNEFALTLFNVFNRHNPYTYFRENGQWKQLSLVPIMPSIRWSISW